MPSKPATRPRLLAAALALLLAPAAIHAQDCPRLNFDVQTPLFVKRGGILTYKITIANYGPGTLTDYDVDLVVPPALTLRSAPRGSSGAKSLSKANDGFTYEIPVPSIAAGKKKTLSVKFSLAQCAPLEYVAISASGHRKGSNACPGAISNTHTKVQAGLGSSKCPAVPAIAPPEGFASWEALAGLYNAYPQSFDISQSLRTGINCTVPYALCAYAQCRIVSTDTNPPLAECGCYGYTNPPPGQESVGLSAQSLLLSTTAQAQNSPCANPNDPRACYAVNTAEVCQPGSPSSYVALGNPPKANIYSQTFQIISTYNVATWPDAEVAADPYCSSGQFVNCCTAGCLLRESYNGYNTTCYCPVYNIKPADKTKFFVGSGDCGTVDAPVGSTVYSGMSLLRNTPPF